MDTTYAQSGTAAEHDEVEQQRVTLVGVDNTPETMPAGTRIARRHPTEGVIYGTVTGWTADGCIGVRYDSGSTSVAPGSFRSYLLVVPAAPLAEVQRAHGYTPVTDPAVVGDCDDCGARSVEVEVLQDFDTRTGDPLADYLVCAVCLPLRCGNPECSTCPTPAGEAARAAASAAQVQR